MSSPQTQPAPKNNDGKKPAPTTAATPPTATPKTDVPPKTEGAKTEAAPPATTGTEGAPTDAGAAAAEPKVGQKVYIVVGEVHEFKNASEAEKFLNKSDDAPKGDFTVIKGKKVEKKAKVSLR